MTVSVCLSVSLCVCLFASMSRELRVRSSRNLACGRGSVVFWRRCDTLCTSGIMDVVMFASKLLLVKEKLWREYQERNWQWIVLCSLCLRYATLQRTDLLANRNASVFSIYLLVADSSLIAYDLRVTRGMPPASI